MIAALQDRLARNPLVSTPERCVATLLLLVFVLKLVAVSIYVPAARSIFDLGFSIDAYVKSLHAGKGFVGCEDFGCHRSSRMPAVPYFLYWMTSLTLSYKIAAYLKVVLLSVLTYLAARLFAREIRLTSPAALAFGALIVAFLTFSPNLIKHMSALHYEEGYLIEVVAITLMLVLTLLLRGPARFHAGIAAAAVLAAAISYLIKSSQVLVLFSVALVVIWLALAAGRRNAAAALLALALVAPAGWTAHNVATSGRLSFMSSYDGENLFRGWNANTLKLYPRCGLDVLFTGIYRCDGETLDLPREVSRFGYPDEWAWNDAYKARAIEWILANPGPALKTFGVKAATVLAWPRLVPYVLEDEDTMTERKRGRIEELAGSLWLITGRIIEFIGLGLALLLLLRGDGRARAVAGASLFIAACYAAPYIVGFGVERHFSVFVMMCAFSTLALVSERQRLAGAQAGPETRARFAIRG